MGTHNAQIIVPDFKEETAEWKAHVERQAELDALAKEAAERDEEMTADVRELQQRYDEQVEAAVSGQGEPPHGPRPERDAAIATVAATAFQRAADHRRDGAKIAALVADDVVQAAGEWWRQQAPEARAAIEKAQQYIDALNNALRQVRTVRGAQDGEAARTTGVRPVEGTAARTAEAVTLDVVAGVVAKGADPFALRAPDVEPGTIRRTGPGLHRWSAPGPSTKEPADMAPAGTDPVRSFL